MKTVSPRRRDLVVPIEFYRRNLEILFKELHFALPETRLVFATTTPVIQSLTTGESRIFHRYNVNVEEFNGVAREVAISHDVEINDLWKLVSERGPEKMIEPNSVHLNEANSQILGEAVANFIRPFLN